MSRLLLRTSSKRLITSTRGPATTPVSSLPLVPHHHITAAQQREDEHDHRYNHMVIRRHFSIHDDRTTRERYADRAREGADRARDATERAKVYSKAGAKRGKAMAKKGALSSLQKLKQYGPVFAGTYFTLYVGTLASLYAGVDSGLVDPVKLMAYINGGEALEEQKSTAHLMMEYLDHYSLTRPAVPFLEKNPHFANLGVAWVATKFTEPFRILVAMVVVPRLANYLGFVPAELREEEEEVVEEVVEEVADVVTDDDDEMTTTKMDIKDAAAEPSKSPKKE